MKLLLDEMLSLRIAHRLRERGFDVIAVAESDLLRRQPDNGSFCRAQPENRTIVTRNIRDFRPLGLAALERKERHSGIILVNNRRFPGHDPSSIGRLIQALTSLLEKTDNLTDSEHLLA